MKVIPNSARSQEVLVLGAAIQFTAGIGGTFNLDTATNTAIPGAGSIVSIAATLDLAGLTYPITGLLTCSAAAAPGSLGSTDYLIKRANTRMTIRYRVPSVTIIATVQTPTNLAVSLLYNPPRAVLTWTAVSPVPDVYRIYKSDNGGASTFLNSTGPGTGFTDTLIAGSHQYVYRVSAVKNSLEGLQSSPATTAVVNNAPTWSGSAIAGTVGTPFSLSLDTITADVEGTARTFSVIAGQLPNGLALSGARSQTMSGTPTTVTSAPFTLRATDGVSFTDQVFTVAIAAGGLSWIGVMPGSIGFVDGAGVQDFAFYPNLLNDPNCVITAADPASTETPLNIIAKALPAQLTLPSVTPPVLRFTDTAAVETFGPSNYKWYATSSVAVGVEADWLKRSGQDPLQPQPGVVWAHDFRAVDEVDQFRWVGDPFYGQQNGDDPNGHHATSGALRRITSDGIGVGSMYCMELIGNAGESVSWWRPFSPLSTDKGATGLVDVTGQPLTLLPRATIDGGDRTSSWHFGNYATNKAPSYDGQVSGNNHKKDGHDFWIQWRMKIDPGRQSVNAPTDGKACYISRTERSLVPQEINVQVNNGTNQRLQMYTNGSPQLQGSAQNGPCADGYLPGEFTNYSEFGGPDWRLPYGIWDTFMVHVIPGHENDTFSLSGFKDNEIHMWAAHQNAPGWTQIWKRTNYLMDFKDDFGNASGWNAFIASVYVQGFVAATWYHRYAQIIFSRLEIPIPAVGA